MCQFIKVGQAWNSGQQRSGIASARDAVAKAHGIGAMLTPGASLRSWIEG